MRIKMIKDIFSDIGRFDSFDQEIYGCVIVSEEFHKNKTNNLHNNCRMIGSVLYDSFDELQDSCVDKGVDYNASTIAGLNHEKRGDHYTITTANLDSSLGNIHDSYFFESLETLATEVGRFDYSYDNIYLVLYSFIGGYGEKACHTEVVLLSEALNNMMSTGSIEKMRKTYLTSKNI